VSGPVVLKRVQSYRRGQVFKGGIAMLHGVLLEDAHVGEPRTSDARPPRRRSATRSRPPLDADPPYAVLRAGRAAENAATLGGHEQPVRANVRERLKARSSILDWAMTTGGNTGIVRTTVVR